jgi:hypothetical protein
MKRWMRLLGFVGVIGVCVSTGLADWADSFDGGTFDLPTWQYLAYPQVPGVTQFGGTVVSGPDSIHYLSLDEGLPYTSGGAAFGLAVGSTEVFADVRVGAVVNVAGDASHNYHGLGARASYFISDGSQTPAPGMIANAYIMHIDWDNGPANLGINIEKVYNNDHSDVHSREFDTLVPGLDNARSFYAALDAIGTDPTYVTGYLYQYKGGPLVAQTETMIDTAGQDGWEDPGPHIEVFKTGQSGVFGQNENDDPPGFHVTYDDISSEAAAPVAIMPNPDPGTADASIHPILSWVEAGSTTDRQIWFGPAENMEQVPAAAGATYDPGLLDANTRYQWRVDQMGPNGTVTGNTWTFTTGQCLHIETFESYADNTAISDAWIHNIPPDDFGQAYRYVHLETDTKATGAKGMRLEYQNQYEPYLTEATHAFSEPQDWTEVEGLGLTFDFRGEGSNMEQPMFVRLEDTAGNLATKILPFNHAVQTEYWRTCNPTALAEFEGVDLTAIQALTIGVGNGSMADQKDDTRDKIYLDNIRLCAYPE